MRNITTQGMGRAPFLAWGTGLTLLKVGLDWIAFQLFGETWSPLIYLHPVKAPLFHPHNSGWGIWFTLWAIAIPFLVAGAWLTIRRLKDACLPPFLLVFFFVPFANFLFFLALVAMPGWEAQSSSPLGASMQVPGATALLMASVGGAVVFLGIMAISIGLLGAYGIGLFLGAPFLSGLTCARLLAAMERSPKPVRRAMSAALLASLLATGVMVAFALEGLVCILMASPLVAVLALFGAFLGSLTFSPLRGMTAGGFALLPFLFVMDQQASEPPLRMVTSDVIIQSNPDRVWKEVVAFPPLPPAKEWIFRAGVASPLWASIEGTGVGAIRRCEFSTGPFVEPITVWSPGRELSFSVRSQPDVLREFTLWAGPRPPHLNDYLQCVKGQFILEPLPGGRTHLVGRTWYRLRMGPESYWGLWSDAFIHRIHLRVLNHVAAQAEADHG